MKRSRAVTVACVVTVSVTAARAAIGPRYGDEARLRVPQVPRRLDPACGPSASERLALGLVHETLVRVDEKGEVQTVLASVTSADGGREIALRVAPGARFHDGRPMTASDVAASLRRFGRTASTAARVFLESLDGAGEAFASDAGPIRIVDDERLVLRLAAPRPAPLAPLASPAAAIVSRDGSGAGPFVPNFVLPSRRLAFRAFAGHVRGRPFLDRLELIAADEAVAGDETIDATLGTSGEPRTTATLALMLDATRPPFDKPEARAAVDASIGRADLVARFLPDAAPRFTLVDALTAPSPARGSEGVVATRIDGAITLAVQRDVGAAVSQRVVARLAATGLRVDVTPVSAAEVRDSAAQARLLLFLPEVPERGLVLREWIELAGAPEQRRAAWLGAAEELDPQRRRAALGALETDILRDLRVLPLASVPFGVEARPRVQGLGFDAAGRLVLENAWVLPR